MVNFVLVAGAWLGAWAWDKVFPLLRAAGHDAYPLTLSGLADKRGVAADGETFVSGWPDFRGAVEAPMAENGGFRAPPAPSRFRPSRRC